MINITCEDLINKLSTGEKIILLDVREPFEHDEFNIGGKLIPMGEIISRINDIPKDSPVVIYCKKGIRSQIAIQRLLQKQSFTNLYNLDGGLEKLKKHPSFPILLKRIIQL